MQGSLSISFYKHKRDAHPKTLEFTWAKWIKELLEHDITDCRPCAGKECPKKNGQAWSPHTVVKDGSRCNDDIAAVTAFVADIDEMTWPEIEELDTHLEGMEAVLVSSHSHREDAPRLRLVMPVSRPVLPGEHEAFRNEVIRRYGLRPDPNTKDMARLYFMPSTSGEVSPVASHQTGAALNVDEVLSTAAPVEPKTSAYSEVPESPTADMQSLRECLKGYAPRKREGDDDEVISRKELVRRVRVGEPLVQPAEKGQRERSCHRLGKILPHLLPEGTPKSAVLELVRPSIVSMPVYDTDGPDDSIDERFAKLEYSWERGVAGRAEQKKVFEAEKAKDAETFDLLKKKFNLKPASASAPAAPAPPPTGGKPAHVGVAIDPDDATLRKEWKRLLWTLPNEDGKEPVLKAAGWNVYVILTLSPEWYGVLRYNELTKDVDTGGAPLDTYEKTSEQITTGVSNWLQHTCHLLLTDNNVASQILHTAKSRAYDPLKDYLKGAKGDTTPRIDTFLETYCGAVTKSSSGKDITEHVRRISRRWFISAVARGLNPGCKVDTVLILEGDQGVKKSTLLDALGGEFFADSQINITDKDSKMLAAQHWIIELAELSALRASETEAQKAFLSSRVDRFRPPYGRTIVRFPRRCVFVGSTNDDRYMNDITGNRRYWPVRCLSFDVKAVRRDRDLLWAEAVAAYEAGFTCRKCKSGSDERCEEHRWWLDNAENEALEEANNERLRDVHSEPIIAWLLAMKPETRPTTVSLHDIATGALGIAADRVDSQRRAIGLSLKASGFVPKQVRVHGAQKWVYQIPETILAAVQGKPSRSHLQVVKKSE